MTRSAHLVRRFAGSLSRRAPSAVDAAWAESHLLGPEAELWRSMPAADRRHTVTVARRFVALRPAAARDEVAGALLHDVGKVASGLGTLGRVAATVAGPRTDRFRRYHDHEALGAALAAGAGSAPATVALIRGDAAPEVQAALRAADDV